MSVPGSASVAVLRYAAFTTDPASGNPAGVVLGANRLGAAEMLALAREVGHSETAFLTARAAAAGAYDVRYFSPEAEVPFCGHATIAAAVALAERGAPRDLVFHVAPGPVHVRTGHDRGGVPTASLTSVPPRVAPAPSELVDAALTALGWTAPELDPALPVRVADAGARHLIIAAATRARLATLRYDYERLRAIMAAAALTTVDLVWREADDRFHARNPFPVGGVYEDPATGSAAAALGAYLRDLGLVVAPAHVTVRQGDDMGRPSRLEVDIPAGTGGVSVTGAAVPIP
ncbi:MAG TPA: PhzF family phenazine biosynthesis protein [Solirubrobacteraceae bacterium]|nr:PhzF family phenazine biosynthesis protein [Solirubrobacteraceae bacterium]